MTAPCDGSVTHWLDRLKAGDPAAARPLWERYCAKLADLARRRLAGTSRAAADEEDVALAAFDSFCRGAAAGRFPDLADRDDLWHVLVVLTARTAATLAEREGRLKRGGGLRRLDVDPDALAGDGPTPEFAALFADELRARLASLGDAVLERVARLRLEGHSVAEIAAALGVTGRTVERKLRVVRSVWEGEPT